MNNQQYKKLERYSHLLVSGLIECSLRFMYCQKVEHFFSGKELGRRNDSEKIHGLKYILEIDLIGFLVKMAYGTNNREVSLEKVIQPLLLEESREYVLRQFEVKKGKYIDVMRELGERRFQELFWKLGANSIEGVYANLVDRWTKFTSNKNFEDFQLVRDKVFAHNEAIPIDEIGKNGDRLYSILDAFYFFRDIESMYREVEEMVGLFSLLITSRYYDHSHMKVNQRKYVEGFVL